MNKANTVVSTYEAGISLHLTDKAASSIDIVIKLLGYLHNDSELIALEIIWYY